MTTFEPAPYNGDLAEGPEGGAAWWVRAPDGVRLRVGYWPCDGAAGTVLLFPGRTEYIEKYGRTAADLCAQGFAVGSIDWRGQGLAERLLDDPMKGHVGLLTDYQLDVAAMLQLAEAQDWPRPWYLLGHSMGGGIGLRALHRGLPVNAAVFTGPMWGIRLSRPMRPAAWALSFGSGLMGMDAAWAPGTTRESYITSTPFEENALTRDRGMWDYMLRQLDAVPEFRLGGPSLRWLNTALAECRRLSLMPSPDMPCLTFVGEDESIVDIARMEARMARWPDGELRVMPGAGHEVLMEVPETRHAVVEAAAELFRHHAEAPRQAMSA